MLMKVQSKRFRSASKNLEPTKAYSVQEAAELLVRTAGLLEMEVSFYDPSLSRPVPVPTGGGHLLFPAEDGATVTRIQQWIRQSEAQPEQLGFCTSSHDTRFSNQSLFRPLSFDE